MYFVDAFRRNGINFIHVGILLYFNGLCEVIDFSTIDTDGGEIKQPTRQ
jgi:hypothetical protein